MQNEIKSMPCDAVCLIFLETLGALISMTCAEEIVGVLIATNLGSVCNRKTGEQCFESMHFSLRMQPLKKKRKEKREWVERVK